MCVLVDLLFVQFIFVVFSNVFSSNPNLIGVDGNAMDEKPLDKNWAHGVYHFVFLKYKNYFVMVFHFSIDEYFLC